VYVADSSSNTIRKISASGDVTTIAGKLWSGLDGRDGTGSAARFYFPSGIAVGATGYLYVADSNSNTIRKGVAALSGDIVIDDPPGFVGAAHHLVFTGSATSCAWRVTRAAEGSVAALSSQRSTPTSLLTRRPSRSPMDKASARSLTTTPP
jgi:DNA-binding beta-propeller fold protein YncE